jgi:squalene cyclase
MTSVPILLEHQNRDGGWPYTIGTSRTEPTAYAVLALSAAGETAAAARGLDWLRAHQLPDGGWPPQAGIEDSNWVTSLAALIPAEQLGLRAHARAIEWLVGTSDELSTPIYRVRQWLRGEPAGQGSGAGWPWAKGTAGWVVPTSLAILALDKENSRRPSDAIRSRIAEGRRFLLERVCTAGGWNHGGVRVYGVEGLAYPETTGVALAAVRGERGPAIDRSIAAAKAFLQDSRSVDGRNWLCVGLMAHGQLPGDYDATTAKGRTLTENALGLLVGEAQKGHAVFWN